MSLVGAEGRSYLRFERDDLNRLAKIARRDMDDFFKRRPDWGRLYVDRRICIAMCQGAALHYVDGTTGINDTDLYTFFRAHPNRRWYPRRQTNYDLGYAKFGQSVDKPNWIGRRVDCMARGITVRTGEDPLDAVRRWLREGKSESARRLAEKAVVLLEPNCGLVLWPHETLRA